jgi:ribosomal protein S10
MANCNVAELRAALTSSIEYCRQNRDREFCDRHLPRLERALEKFEESREESDRLYVDWREDWAAEKQAWKALSQILRDVQNQLDAMNVVGYPDARVRHWDAEQLDEVVEQMKTFLRESADDIEGADDLADKIERRQESAYDAKKEQEDSRDVYRGRVRKRSDARGQAVEAVRDFREVMRETLGVDHEDYQSIRWPYAVSPDDAVI